MVITDTLNRDGRLFVSYVQPHKPVSGDTIKRWVKQVLTNAGIDTSTFTAHSTRSASTSVAANAGLPLQDIPQAAGWSSESTFYKFLPTTHQRHRGGRLLFCQPLCTVCLCRPFNVARLR